MVSGAEPDVAADVAMALVEAVASVEGVASAAATDEAVAWGMVSALDAGEDCGEVAGRG